jgi:hypothetical protein
MAGYGSVYAPSGCSQDDRIVADVRDLRSIRAELARLGVGVVDLAEIPKLQVAMIGLADLDAVHGLPGADGVGSRLAQRYAEDNRYRTAPTPLDVVMTLVRDAFAAKFHRQPRMGKNRSMEVVGGLPHWAAAELPVPVADPDLLPRGLVAGPGLRVGVLDTAMCDNPVLAGRFRCADFVPEKGPHPSWAGHATFIVGRILQRAPGAEVWVKQVLGGRYGTSTAWELAAGMAAFLGTGTEVLNLSLGCFTDDDEPPFLLVRAVEKLAAEMVVVAAAGNHGRRSYPMPALDEDGRPMWRPEALSPSSPMWPAAIDGVVAVGAADIGAAAGGAVRMTPADFTPVDVPWIQLWAPGVAVVSTYLEGEAVATVWEWNDDGTISEPMPWRDTFHGWASWTGTSMSAGDVTGEIAGMAQRRNVGSAEAYRMIANRPGGAVGPDDIRPWI